MKKGISKTRRFIESFALIGFYILFITLAVGQAGSKVGADAQVPMQTGDQLSRTKSIDRFINCSCIGSYRIYDEDLLEYWVGNERQLSLKRLKTDPGEDNSVMDVEIALKYKRRSPYQLTLRISKNGRIYLKLDEWSWPPEENCEAYSSPCCCFYYQNICSAMKWLFPWIELNCWQTFWKCWIWDDCYKNDYYHNILFWILLEYFYCCDNCW